MWIVDNYANIQHKLIRDVLWCIRWMSIGGSWVLQSKSCDWTLSLLFSFIPPFCPFHTTGFSHSFLLPDSCSLSTVVSEAFVRFFVEMVGHYSLFMGGADREDESSVSSPSSPSPSSSSSFQREAFRKAVTSKSLRRFLEVFMETQMFTSFIQERELRRQGLRGTERVPHYINCSPPAVKFDEIMSGNTCWTPFDANTFPPYSHLSWIQISAWMHECLNFWGEHRITLQ